MDVTIQQQQQVLPRSWLLLQQQQQQQQLMQQAKGTTTQQHCVQAMSAGGRWHCVALLPSYINNNNNKHHPHHQESPQQQPQHLHLQGLELYGWLYVPPPQSASLQTPPEHEIPVVASLQYASVDDEWSQQSAPGAQEGAAAAAAAAAAVRNDVDVDNDLELKDFHLALLVLHPQQPETVFVYAVGVQTGLRLSTHMHTHTHQQGQQPSQSQQQQQQNPPHFLYLWKVDMSTFYRQNRSQESPIVVKVPVAASLPLPSLCSRHHGHHAIRRMVAQWPAAASAPMVFLSTCSGRTLWIIHETHDNGPITLQWQWVEDTNENENENEKDTASKLHVQDNEEKEEDHNMNMDMNITSLNACSDAVVPYPEIMTAAPSHEREMLESKPKGMYSYFISIMSAIILLAASVGISKSPYSGILPWRQSALEAWNSPPRLLNDVHAHRTKLRTAIPVYSHFSSTGSANKSMTSDFQPSHLFPIMKALYDLQHSLDRDNAVPFLESKAMTVDQQRAFVQETCPYAVDRFEEFLQKEQESFAVEVFKWCALGGKPTQKTDTVAVYWEMTSPATLHLHDIIAPISEDDNNNNNSSGSGSGIFDNHEVVFRNTIVLADDNFFPQAAITGPIVIMRDDSSIPDKMLRTLLETPLDTLLTRPLFIPQSLYDLVREEIKEQNTLTPGLHGPHWQILQQSCPLYDPRPSRHGRTLHGGGRLRLLYECHASVGFCCTVHDGTQTLFVSNLVLTPIHHLEPHNLPQPYRDSNNINTYGMGATVAPENDADPEIKKSERLLETNGQENNQDPYIATLQSGDDMEEVPAQSSSGEATESSSSARTVYERMYAKCPLPILSGRCSRCLINLKTGANCITCGKYCRCFCEQLCTTGFDHDQNQNDHHGSTHFPSVHFHVTPPKYRRDPQRIIPRIVHQTWYEQPALNPKKYPSWSRFVQSFQTSGWEYRFYKDADAAEFIAQHFPPQVLEAYNSIVSGAFKADLFRYCVLLIHGGLYADIDIMLESDLDFSIPSDVGFMVPLDEPGNKIGHQMCLWNGFMAAAPGHPILAQAIESAVNHIRNRFTSVDMDATFCPDPELSVLHAYDILFTTGPCLLGSSLNRVLGRHGLHNLVPGELKLGDVVTLSNEGVKEEMLSSTVKTNEQDDDRESREIPKKSLVQIQGRIVLLQQNKTDMGAHRFTLLEQNLIVCATDLPESNEHGYQSAPIIKKKKVPFDLIKDSFGDSEDFARDNDSEDRNHQHYSKVHAERGIYGFGVYVDQEKARENIRLLVESF